MGVMRIDRPDIFEFIHAKQNEHVAVLAVAAELVVSAVSKTCNVDSRVSWDEFKRVYDSAW